MCLHQTLTGLPKYCPKKLNQAPCTKCSTSNMTDLTKGTTVDTTNLQPGKLLHMEFSFYNATSVNRFSSVFPVVCENTIILWAFPTESKISSVRIISLTITTLKNEQHTCKHVRVDKDYDLENSTDVINLLVDEFKKYMETTGDDASCLNGKNERHNRITNNMVRPVRLDSNKRLKKWCYTA